jgi:hypothetical protein
MRAWSELMRLPLFHPNPLHRSTPPLPLKVAERWSSGATRICAPLLHSIFVPVEQGRAVEQISCFDACASLIIGGIHVGRRQPRHALLQPEARASWA